MTKVLDHFFRINISKIFDLKLFKGNVMIFLYAKMRKRRLSDEKQRLGRIHVAIIKYI